MKFEYVEEKNLLEQPIETEIPQKQPTKLKIETIGIGEKDIGEQKIVSIKAVKQIKSKATVNNLIKILDDTDITQDDLWMFLRILTRNRLTTQRLPKRILEPIFKSFINKKLSRSE